MKPLIFILALCCYALASQLNIALKIKADVEPGVVRLGQIAEINGNPDLSKKVWDLEVGKVAEPGRKTRITEKALKGFFIKSIAGNQDVVFSGAKFCDVIARAGKVSADSIKILILKEVRKRIPEEAQEGKDWIFEAAKIPNNLVTPEQGGSILVTIPPNFIGIGQNIATVQILSSRKVISKHSIPFTIRRFEYVAELKNGIRKGEAIGKDDFKMVRQETTFQKRKVIKKAEEAIGRTSIRILKAGDILVDNALTAPYAVKEGESVKVFVKVGGATIQMNAIAKKNAFKGQTISMRNVDSGKDILATVSGQGEAWVN